LSNLRIVKQRMAAEKTQAALLLPNPIRHQCHGTLVAANPIRPGPILVQ
jgi:hypothetical protein